MSQIETNTHKKSKNTFKSKTLRIDLTPMVDLGFLLITFFILTTALSQPTITKLIMPKDSKMTTPVKDNAVLTLMLTRNDSIQYYNGSSSNKKVNSYCTIANLRSVIEQKRKQVGKVLNDPSETVIIIYPGNQSTYKNFMNVLDEIQINDITRYFIMD